MAPAQAQEAAPSPEPTAAQASDADADNEARAALAAIGRLDDADTALALAADGAALYDREAVKLDGYAYCSQAVELAEKGEFRESARAASHASSINASSPSGVEAASTVRARSGPSAPGITCAGPSNFRFSRALSAACGRPSDKSRASLS